LPREPIKSYKITSLPTEKKTIKGSLASKADEEALLSANVAESNLSLTDLFLLGKQID